jgi:site-specific DNA-methyltransferase (adenine-specific)
VKPYYESGGVTIYHGRCEDVLPVLPSESVDLVLTDPPYGVGFNYGTGASDKEDGYIEWLWPIIEQAERIVSSGGYVVVWQAAKHARRWAEWFPREWRLLALPKEFVQMRPVALQWATDYALCWRVGKVTESERRFKEWQPANARDWFKSSTAWWTPLSRRHPCPRPLDTVHYLLACLCPPGGTVLDPFLGSGTTARAGKDLGRRVIGIEIEEQFCALSVERLSQEVLPFEVIA